MYSACPMSIRWTSPELLHSPQSVEGDEDSPQSVEGEEDSPITTMSDVYSFGSLMFELATHEDPYDSISSEIEVLVLYSSN